MLVDDTLTTSPVQDFSKQLKDNFSFRMDFAFEINGISYMTSVWAPNAKSGKKIVQQSWLHARNIRLMNTGLVKAIREKAAKEDT